MRAVMEGLAFAARDCYAAMGALPGEVRITGGAARSRALGAILGAALECDVRICSRGEAGAAGAAMIAAVATGLYPDMTACAERLGETVFERTTNAGSGVGRALRRACSRPIWRRGSRRGRSGSSLLRCVRKPVMSSSIAIVGDRFMLPSVFAEKITAACGNGVDIRLLEQPWPDEPMEHGYAGSKLDGLKEFMGEPDEIVELHRRRRARSSPIWRRSRGRCWSACRS